MFCNNSFLQTPPVNIKENDKIIFGREALDFDKEDFKIVWKQPVDYCGPIKVKVEKNREHLRKEYNINPLNVLL